MQTLLHKGLDFYICGILVVYAYSTKPSRQFFLIMEKQCIILYIIYILKVFPRTKKGLRKIRKATKTNMRIYTGIQESISSQVKHVTAQDA